MTDLENLLATVLANPDDDLPRLVFADWLEENGEADRAEFIRLECFVSSRGDCDHLPLFCPEERCEICDAKDRADHLRSRNEGKWLSQFMVRREIAVGCFVVEYKPPFRVRWLRGFIGGVGGHLEQLLDGLHLVIDEHPIESVEIFGSWPTNPGNGFTWYCSWMDGNQTAARFDLLPYCLFKRLRADDYNTRLTYKTYWGTRDDKEVQKRIRSDLSRAIIDEVRDRMRMRKGIQ